MSLLFAGGILRHTECVVSTLQEGGGASFPCCPNISRVEWLNTTDILPLNSGGLKSKIKLSAVNWRHKMGGFSVSLNCFKLSFWDAGTEACDRPCDDLECLAELKGLWDSKVVSETSSQTALDTHHSCRKSQKIPTS